ncbi:MAG: hypothetical protein DIKNOCCD_01523 [bacterium]|nr:hypothetical protein [bacterium]MBV6481794.1 hypothetical protein [bacterium]
MIQRLEEIFSNLFFLAGFLITGAFIAFSLFLLYAKIESEKWRESYLDDLKKHTLIYSVTGDEFPPLQTIKQEYTNTFNQIQNEKTYFLHLEAIIKKGRVKTSILNNDGKEITLPVFSSTPGYSHCFIGWKSQNTGPVKIKIEETLPLDYPEYYDIRASETLLICYKHHDVKDLAKFEFSKDNKITVSSTGFPNGHETMPFLINKLRWSVNEGKVPAYWSAFEPCSATLTFNQTKAISRLFMRVPAKIQKEPPKVTLIDYEGQLIDCTTYGETNKYSPPKSGNYDEYQHYFPETDVKSILISFLPTGKKNKICYLHDFCVPEPTEFSIEKVSLYEVNLSASNCYPVNLSFLDPYKKPPE